MTNRLDGDMLRREIARQEKTVSEFARSVGLSPPVVFSAMAGAKPTLKTLGKLARGLGVENPLELLREEQTP